mmetsp:Transcript_14668/g.27190  ORF Transcript_14668/g.27190 Transcript_14668/m.27190 type:complete len:315 (+) Transcript_14668:450-1394(+)
MICTGILIVYLLGVPLPLEDFSSSWNNWVYVILVVAAAFAVLQIYLLTFHYVHETPKWLVDHGHPEEAKTVLGMIFTTERVEREFDNLTPDNKEVEEDHSVSSQEFLLAKELREVSFTDLFRPPLLKPTLIGISLGVLGQGSGINVIIFCSTELLTLAGGASNVHWMTVMVGVANLVPTFFCPVLVEKFGRKTILVWGFVGMAICNIIVGFCSSVDANPWVFVGFMLVFLVCFELSIGTVFWVYCSETMIDKSLGIAAAINWVAGAVVVGTLLFLISPDSLGISGTFYLYGGLCVFAWVFLVLFVPESKRSSVN